MELGRALSLLSSGGSPLFSIITTATTMNSIITFFVFLSSFYFFPK